MSTFDGCLVQGDVPPERAHTVLSLAEAYEKAILAMRPDSDEGGAVPDQRPADEIIALGLVLGRIAAQFALFALKEDADYSLERHVKYLRAWYGAAYRHLSASFLDTVRANHPTLAEVFSAPTLKARAEATAKAAK